VGGRFHLCADPDLISRVTDAVLEEVREWQSRPLDAVYPIVFFDALRVKIRDEGLVKNKAAYVALAYNCDGEKDVLGLWVEQTEGAKFWLRVINELKARGVNDILIAVVDGLKGFPEAITSVYQQTLVQTCIVGLLKKSAVVDSLIPPVLFDSRGWQDARSERVRSAGAVHHWFVTTARSRRPHPRSCRSGVGPLVAA
jgi:transposase-like protein